MSARNRRWEIATTGFDEYLQLIGGDPYSANGASTSVGLRVPTLATPTVLLGGLTSRYLFLLSSFSVPEGGRVRIRGYRQMVTIGYKQVEGESSPTTRIVEQLVTSPFWRFADGNVSWHIHRIGSPNAQGVPQNPGNGPADMSSFKQYWADGPALLYGPPAPARPAGDIYTNLGSYAPPNAGKPYGQPVASKQGTFYDLRSPWEADRAWDSLDIPIDGPDTIAFFASVRQTNPEARVALAAPSTPLNYQAGLSSEEQFLLNFPNAIYWRVAGSLIVEEGETP
jgi:hypothetical protein